MSLGGTVGPELEAFLAGGLPGGLTVGGLVALFFFGLYRGWIATGREMRELKEIADTRVREAREDRDKRLAEMTEAVTERIKDKNQQIADWREAYLTAEAALAVERQHKEKLLELSRASAHVLQSLPSLPDDGAPDGR